MAISGLFGAVCRRSALPKGVGRVFLRTLLSEGHIRYATLVQTKDGWTPTELYVEGPTGLLMTTTNASLHPEDESRLLSITVKDTPEQIQCVLEIIAEKHSATPDLTDWHEFHEWLSKGPHEVDVLSL